MDVESHRGPSLSSPVFHFHPTAGVTLEGRVPCADSAPCGDPGSLPVCLLSLSDIDTGFGGPLDKALHGPSASTFCPSLVAPRMPQTPPLVDQSPTWLTHNATPPLMHSLAGPRGIWDNVSFKGNYHTLPAAGQQGNAKDNRALQRVFGDFLGPGEDAKRPQPLSRNDHRQLKVQPQPYKQEGQWSTPPPVIGAAGLYFFLLQTHTSCSSSHLHQTLQAVGKGLRIPEDLQDQRTLNSGSGSFSRSHSVFCKGWDPLPCPNSHLALCAPL